MTSAKFILPGLLLAIGTVPAFAGEAAKDGGAHGAVLAKVAAPTADVQTAAQSAAADKAGDTAARPKSKRHRQRKAAAPATGKETQAAATGQDPAPVDAGHAPVAPVVAAVVAPTPRVLVKDRATAAVAVAVAQAFDSHPAPAHAHAATDAHDEQLAHAAPAAEPAAAATAAAVRGEECNPPFKTEVAAWFDRWNASLRTGDPKKVVANYAPDSVLLPTLSNRARFTTAEKEAYFAHFLQRRPEGRIDDRVIEVDCNSAIDSGLYTFRFMDGSSVKARYTFAYKRVNGEWLISSHHSSAMPEKAAVAGQGAESAHPGASDEGNPARGWVRF